MIRRVRGTLAAGILAALSLGSVVLYVTMGREDDPLEAANTISFLFAPLVMGGFGGLLLHRRPENVIGWLFIAAGAGLALAGVPQAYAFAAYATQPRLPLWDLAVILQSILWPAYLPALVLLFMLFPDGRPLSPRWAVAGVVAATAPLALLPTPSSFPRPSVRSPSGRSTRSARGCATRSRSMPSAPTSSRRSGKRSSRRLRACGCARISDERSVRRAHRGRNDSRTPPA